MATFALAHVAMAAEPPVEPSTAGIIATAWPPRFEHWVERVLVEPELADAIGGRPGFDPNRIVRTLDALTRHQVEQLPRRSRLPEYVIPEPTAVGVRGAAIDAVRMYVRRDMDGALELLHSDELAHDPAAAHLLAQFSDLDQLEAQPPLRLAVIDAYRRALRLQGSGPMAERARLRIAQVYLEIGFHVEARAEIDVLLRSDPDPPLALFARVTRAEAAYLERDPERTLLIIRALAEETLEPGVRIWAIRRGAESQFALAGFRQAAGSYVLLRDELEEGLEPEDALRAASAELESGAPERALTLLDELLGGTSPAPIAATAQLLRARALRETGKTGDVRAAAEAALQAEPGSDAAALAVCEFLTAAPAEGEESAPSKPTGTAALLRHVAERPSRALLAYSVARTQPAESTRDLIVRLGRLHRRLGEGQVREVVRAELSSHIGSELRQALSSSGGDVDPDVLRTLRRYLGPHHLDEDSLLLAIEAFRRSGDDPTCGRWASLLRRRDVRPIRRGLGAWREVQCKVSDPSDGQVPQHLIEMADSGMAGPFSLALAARAAEHTLAAGDARGARSIYGRALESFQEPALSGPVLLRVGQLLEAAGQYEFAAQRTLRGLALLDNDESRADPFRAAGVVALGRLDEHLSTHDRLRATLRNELRHAQGWRLPAYGYLAFRIGSAEAPEGESLFARASEEIRSVNELGPRIEKASARVVAEEKRRGAAR